MTESTYDWGSRGFGHYIAARAMWDANEGGPAVYEQQFLDKAFGANGLTRNKMREFYEMVWATGTSKPLMSTHLINQMYVRLRDALAATTDAKIRRRIYDLVLYTRYIDKIRKYRS